MVNLVLVVLPFLYLAFIAADRVGVWDYLSGLDDVEHITARFELSYAPNASHPVRVGDREWKPLLKLAHGYSNAQLPPDREPRVIPRSVALVLPELPPKVQSWASRLHLRRLFFSCVEIGPAMTSHLKTTE